ncbi:cytochrome P450 [Daedalea quercina L-15889]|uniref:Cytochrome P450 n=1 Tax=Daedalea quercina L-15889 TaxID=1314783 RepID=A0A165UCR7_9APHY|nr:cytochrome P450 [Daedalea quercina L-15889]
MVTFSNIFSISAFVLLTSVLACVLWQRQRKHLPPGPRGWPVIGNFLDIPKAYAWKTFAKWGIEWGDIMSITVFGQTTVVLNSPNLAFALLDKKGARYSDRPRLPVVGEIMGLEYSLGMHHYNSRWKHLRKLFAQAIGTRASLLSMSGHLEYEAFRFLRCTMLSPGTLAQQVKRYIGTSMLRITYGYRVEDENDQMFNDIDRTLDSITLALAPGTYLADFFPVLTKVPAWFPGAGWKRKAQICRTDFITMRELPFQYARQHIHAGTLESCFVSGMLEDNNDPEHDAVIAEAAFSMYTGGFETSVATILAFFLAMMCFPEVQKKAQDEIDSVIGNDRLPSLADLDQLPYVTALFWEVLRWHAVLPLGATHRLTADDVHMGYLIPEGTMVVANIWAMLRDPRLYTSPEIFNPDRFIPSGGSEPEYDPRRIGFGFGRRICPGMQLAELSLCLTMGMVLSIFNISKPIVNGKVVEPPMQSSANIVSHPLPFECDIQPRSAKAAALVSDAFEDHTRSV